jgi:hypothetical protein
MPVPGKLSNLNLLEKDQLPIRSALALLRISDSNNAVLLLPNLVDRRASRATAVSVSLKLWGCLPLTYSNLALPQHYVKGYFNLFYSARKLIFIGCAVPNLRLIASTHCPAKP